MIDLVSLRKSFGNREVLRDLSLTVSPGEVYCLLGANGSGKTTAINILCGLLEADAGTTRVDGVEGATARSRIGVVSQEVALYQQLTVRENLRLFGRLYGLDRIELDLRTREVIEALHLERYAEVPVAELSGGWRRRVHLAVGVVHAPAAVVLDEPTAGLDVEARDEVWNLVRHLRANGTAVLLTTHHLDEAERLATRIGILHDGKIIIEGSMDELRATFPADCVVDVEAASLSRLERRAAELTWAVRRWGTRVSLLLPHPLTLREVASALEGCALTSLAVRDVGLEHVLLEATHGEASRNWATSPRAA